MVSATMYVGEVHLEDATIPSFEEIRQSRFSVLVEWAE